MLTYNHMKNLSASLMYVRIYFLSGMIYLGKQIRVGLAEAD